MKSLRAVRAARALGAACAALCIVTAGARAQSLLDRPPNLNGGWVGSSGQLYFNFMHRFISSDAPERKVTNFPTFTLAAGLPFYTLLGAEYSTNSNVAPRYPNEWELFLRHAPLQQDRGAPVDLAAQLSYNFAVQGVDGELSLARRAGPLRLIAVGRTLSDPSSSDRRWAVGGGGTLRISRYFALAGDVATLTDRAEDEKVAWSAGLHLAIPGTPHTLSIQASNAATYTLQGLSRGDDTRRYGFEFTIPLTLNRWFGHNAEGHAQPAGTPPALELAPADSGATPTGPVARAGMRNLAFVPGTIEVTAGTTVEWTNNDPLSHSVTSDDGSFASGLIGSGHKWRHTFTAPGTYTYHCTPHPFMKGTVIVR